jgi:hypothetical protein
VGAPKGTYPGGLSPSTMSTPENETGLVYNCPVRSGSCGRIGTGEGNDARLFDPDRKSAGNQFHLATIIQGSVYIYHFPI